MPCHLIVANQTLNSQPLFSAIQELTAGGRRSFHVVVPATPARDQLVWTEGGAHAIARRRLDEALLRVGQLPAAFDGEVGDPNPVLAVRDALAYGPAIHSIIVSTLPSPWSRWLRQDLPSRIQRDTGLPVRAIVVPTEHAMAR